MPTPAVAENPLPWWRRWRTDHLVWLPAAWLTAFALFLVDRVRNVATGEPFTLSQNAVAWTLWCGHQTAALAVMTVGTVSFVLAAAATPLVPLRRWALWGPGVVAAALLAWPSWVVGTSITEGAWISEQWFAPVVRAVPVLGLCLGVSVLMRIAAEGFPDITQTTRRRWLTALLFAVALIAEIADHQVFPGLHPLFHLTAYLTAAACLIVAFERVLAASPLLQRSRVRSVAAILTGLSLGTAPLGWSTASPAVRASLILESPVAAHAVREFGSHEQVPILRQVLTELDPDDGKFEKTAEERTSAPLERPWNVLMIVVDTLRADALEPARPPEGKPFAQPGDTPFLDDWLTQSFRFKHAYAASSMTHRSMPSMFFSAEAYETLDVQGPSLARRMEDQGRTPFAITVAYFLQAKYEGARRMLEGFGDTKIYEKSEAGSLVQWTKEMVQNHRDQPFFGWLHFYNMHDPGFAGEMLRTGSRVERYQRSLRWLDQQIAALAQTLEDLGVADNTIVVLTADHGESLGDNRHLLHGPTIFEEEVRVPLSIHVPGQKGRIIEEAVGNIDLAPTLMELVGSHPEPQDRGRSLARYLREGTGEPHKGTYYLENSNGSIVGVVEGRQKLIFDRKAQTFYRFDLAVDPTEERNLFDSNGSIDRHLMRSLIEFNPKLAKDELEVSEVEDLLVQRLRQVDPKEAGAALPFLVRLAALAPTPAVTDAATDLFRSSASPRAKALLMSHLWPTKRKHWANLAWRYLAEAERDDEILFLEQLAFSGQDRFANRRLGQRLNEISKTEDIPRWTAWLRLTAPWRKPIDIFGPPILRMLSSPSADGHGELLELLLDNAAGLHPPGGDVRNQIATRIMPLVSHDDPRLRVAAVEALSALKAPEAADLFVHKVADSTVDLRTRRAMILGLVKLDRQRAVPILIELGEQPGLTSTIVTELGKAGDERALPLLRELAESHYNHFLRRTARRAIKQIEGSARRRDSRSRRQRD